MSDPRSSTLAAELEQLGFEKLFRRPDSEQQVNRLWGEPNNPDRLVALAFDSARPWLSRFFAAEVVMHKQMFALLQAKGYDTLAPVYASALHHNASGLMSDWGFLENMQDSGWLGSRVVMFGRGATAVLKPMLDDTTEVLYRTPPLQPLEVRSGYRIRDFAALYLSKIHGIPLQLTNDSVQRDAEIARLKAQLP